MAVDQAQCGGFDVPVATSPRRALIARFSLRTAKASRESRPAPAGPTICTSIVVTGSTALTFT